LGADRHLALIALALAMMTSSCGSSGQPVSTDTSGFAGSTTSPAEWHSVFDYLPTRSTDVGIEGLVNRADEIVTLVPMKAELASVSDSAFTLVSARVETVVRSRSGLANGAEILIRQVGSTKYQGVAILQVGVQYLAFLLPLEEHEVLGGDGRYILVREFGGFREAAAGSYSTDDARAIGGFTDLPARIAMSDVQRLTS
jgi:hypothetical protein